MAEEKHLSKLEKLKKQFSDMVEKQIINDKQHNIALGCALGLGINFIPTMGLGFVFAFLLALVFRANRVSAAVTSIVTGPAIPLMYTFNLLIGGLIMDADEISQGMVHCAQTFVLPNIKNNIFNALEYYGTTFLLGSVINAAVFGTLFYFFVSALLKKMSNPSK